MVDAIRNVYFTDLRVYGLETDTPVPTRSEDLDLPYDFFHALLDTTRLKSLDLHLGDEVYEVLLDGLEEVREEDRKETRRKSQDPSPPDIQPQTKRFMP